LCLKLHQFLILSLRVVAVLVAVLVQPTQVVITVPVVVAVAQVVCLAVHCP
jgi:hypothetical protein